MATQKQLRLIYDTVDNHLKYYDTTFAAYLKLRQEILLVNSTIIRELNQDEADQVSSTPRKLSSKLSFKLHQLQLELSKTELTYKTHMQELDNFLQIQKTMKPDIITGIKSQLEEVTKRDQELVARINDIETMQKPLLDRITALTKSFNSNLVSSTARTMYPTMIHMLGKDESKREKESMEIDFKSLVFDTKELQRQFTDLTESKITQTTNISEFIGSNTRLFDKLNDDEDDSSIIYKLSRSALHDLGATTTLEEYDCLIAKTIEQIQTLQNEGESTRLSWESNADKVIQFSAIIRDSSGDGDTEMGS
ncbi:uncharacterized protein LODBEIA_P18700 [Lodderomyces beijingensis]|uniref:Autophagy-related protein 17 n=1 Tax=Lodderomyces beijingensis TaxID=1775926 RepID=A0ABP0ZHL5_9ASCO